MTSAGTPAQPGSRAGPVLVTGGTGTLGRLLVPRLVDAGATVCVLSRSVPRLATGTAPATLQGDLDTGAGLERALAGVTTVVHLAGQPTGDEVRAARLVDAARAAGIGHLVLVSVVGADRVPVVSRIDRMAFGYFAAKAETERVVAESGVPFTTLRATQFHEFVWSSLELLDRGPVVVLPGGNRFQSVAAAEVADRLTALTFGGPQGRVPDLAGPEVLTTRSMLADYLRIRGRRRLVVQPNLPGRAAAAFRAGANLADGGDVGRQTWAEWLAENHEAH